MKNETGQELKMTQDVYLSEKKDMDEFRKSPDHPNNQNSIAEGANAVHIADEDLSSSQQPLVTKASEEVRALSLPNDQRPLRRNTDAHTLELRIPNHPDRRDTDTQKADLEQILDQSSAKPTLAPPALTHEVHDLTGALKNMLQLIGFNGDPAKPVLEQYANFTSALALKQMLYNKIHAITDCEPDTKSIFEMLMKDYMISVASDVEKLSNERLAEQADSAKI